MGVPDSGTRSEGPLPVEYLHDSAYACVRRAIMAVEEKIPMVKVGRKYFMHNPETGELVHLKGYGSMKGRIAFREDIDLTKPIWEQVFGLRSVRKQAAPQDG